MNPWTTEDGVLTIQLPDDPTPDDVRKAVVTRRPIVTVTISVKSIMIVTDRFDSWTFWLDKVP